MPSSAPPPPPATVTATCPPGTPGCCEPSRVGVGRGLLVLRCCHRDAGMLSPHPSPLWGHLGRGGGGCLPASPPCPITTVLMHGVIWGRFSPLQCSSKLRVGWCRRWGGGCSK